MPEGLIWAYGVIAADAPAPDGPEVIRHGDLTALVSAVPADEYGADALHRNLNDLGWLERVARRHEEVLDAALTRTTVVPLSLCTIFADENGVRAMLEREHEALAGALEALHGQQEWGVKVLIDPDLVAAAAQAGEEPAPTAARGGGYLQQRRREREQREAARALAADVADEVHSRCAERAADSVVLPAQNRELSGYEGDMVLNAAYLLAAEEVPTFQEVAAALESFYEDYGVLIVVTGPWPPYHFVPGEEPALA